MYTFAKSTVILLTWHIFAQHWDGRREEATPICDDGERKWNADQGEADAESTSARRYGHYVAIT